jgi:hypothetical protein
MKLLASLTFGLAIFVATAFGLAQPAMADDDVSIGVKLGPLCVGLCIDGDDDDGDRGGHHGDYDDDSDAGFYAHREDYYHQRYDRRASNHDYSTYRDDGYAGYRRHHQARHHAAGYEENGDDENGEDDGED